MLDVWPYFYVSKQTKVTNFPLQYVVFMCQGISFEDFKLFSDFLDQMSEVETALSMYTMAGTGATKGIR